MKKIKYMLIGLLALLLVLGLWYGRRSKAREYTKTEYVLDTTCSVTFYGDDAEAAAKAVFSEIRRIDDLMSLYKKSSDVAKINSAKAGEAVTVSEDTYKVIETALSIGEMSNGAFDITIAPVTELWNFEAENPVVPQESEIAEALSRVNYKAIELCKNRTVIKQNDDTMIDLGGAAKGYAGDCAVKAAEKYNLSGGIIDLGGNILCFGKNPKSENGKWTVGIQIPFSPAGTYEKTVEISSGAVVTSGTYQRYFEAGGKKYHHIIDPKTGRPAEQDYDSVTVVSDNSLEADCLATAAYVMGENAGKNLVEEFGGEIYFEQGKKNQ